MRVQSLQPAPNRARVRQLANEGRHRQGGQTYQNARSVGQNYLSAIASEASGSLDGVLAGVANTASAQRLYPESAYKTQKLALDTLAAGVGGPIGPALAAVGYSAIYDTIWHEASMAYHDGRSIGASFLDGINDHSSDATERRLARAARVCAAERLYNDSAFKAQSVALQRIRDGVAGQDSAKTLARWGRDARMKCRSNEDARNLLYPLLETLSQDSDPRVAALADVGRKASGAYLYQDSGSLAQDTALVKILESPVGSTLEADLADYGRRALNNCERAQDQRNIGHKVLRGVAQYAQEPAHRLLATVADTATCPHLYNRSAAGVHYEAFDLLTAGSETDPLKLLGRFGLAVQGRGDTSSDTRTMGHEVLKALLDQDSDHVKKSVLGATVRLSEQAGADSVALGLQKFAFNWVIKAPTIPEGQLEDGGELDPGVLRQRIDFNTSVKEMLQAENTQNRQTVQAKQQEMSALADQFNPLVPQDRKLTRRFNIARTAQLVGMASLVGGFLARTMAPQVGVGLMAVGGLATAGGWLVKGQAQQQLRAVRDEFWPLRHAYDRANGEQQATQAATMAIDSITAELDEAIARDQRSLEVVKMSEADSDAGLVDIEIDAEQVTIGDFTIFVPQDTDQEAPVASSTGNVDSGARRLPDSGQGERSSAE